MLRPGRLAFLECVLGGFGGDVRLRRGLMTSVGSVAFVTRHAGYPNVKGLLGCQILGECAEQVRERERRQTD